MLSRKNTREIAAGVDGVSGVTEVIELVLLLGQLGRRCFGLVRQARLQGGRLAQLADLGLGGGQVSLSRLVLGGPVLIEVL